MKIKDEAITYLERISLFLLALLFFLFPLFVNTQTTDLYIIPKQALLIGIAILCSLIFAAKMLFYQAIRIKRTPLDVPLILFILAVFLSSLFSVNRADSLVSFVPLLFSSIIYFLTVNSAKTKNTVFFLYVALLAGGALLALFYILTHLNIYPLPFAFSRNQTFSLLGSLLDQAIYLALLFPLALYAYIKSISSIKTIELKTLIFGIFTIIIAIALFITIYNIFSQKPILLPFRTGFQTAFAAISQDTSRTITGFLFGSGFGTFATDFTRFKQASFNQTNLWSFTFFRSSSFILELLATTGFLGILTFAFLMVKIINQLSKEKGYLFFVSLGIVILMLILPLSFVLQTLLFFILAIFTAIYGLSPNKQNQFFDVELEMVALRKGLLTLEIPERVGTVQNNIILPLAFNVAILIIVGVLGFWSINYLRSDLMLQKSLVLSSQNDAQATYRHQLDAIKIFPYRDTYYRIFSQTNLALANGLSSPQANNSTPSATTQKTIIDLIQQAINTGRRGIAVAPQTATNWQNLAGIYRGLIGFGQNAENFAIATQQQSVLLDPNNPQQYLTLGGIYYQLGQWDNAQNQFQIAVNLKPDFANAHYNLGHALKQKRDTKGALSQFEIVKNLVISDPKNLQEITAEIKKLSQITPQNKIQTPNIATLSNKETLGISSPSAALPSKNPPIKIPQPAISTKSAR